MIETVLANRVIQILNRNTKESRFSAVFFSKNVSLFAGGKPRGMCYNDWSPGRSSLDIIHTCLTLKWSSNISLYSLRWYESFMMHLYGYSIIDSWRNILPVNITQLNVKWPQYISILVGLFLIQHINWKWHHSNRIWHIVQTIFTNELMTKLIFPITPCIFWSCIVCCINSISLFWILFNRQNI